MDGGREQAAAPPAEGPAVQPAAPGQGQQQQQQAFLQQQQQQAYLQQQHNQQEQMRLALERAANAAADQQAEAADGTINIQRLAQQVGGMATLMAAMQTNAAMLQQQGHFQQQQTLAAATAAGLAAQAAGQAAQSVRPPAPFTPRKEKLPVPVLPDPAEDFEGFMRKYAEFTYQWVSAPGVTDWDIAKALKDALPDAIQSDFVITCPIPQLSLQKLEGYIRENYESEFETRQLKVVNELQAFQRSTPSLREYIRQFELLIAKCATHNHRVDNKDLMLISKAQLSPEAQSEVLRHMNSFRDLTGTAITYAQLKRHLLTYEGNSTAFVRVNATQVANDDNASQNVHWQQQQREGGWQPRNPRWVRRGDRRPSPYSKGKDKGGKGGWRRERTPTDEICRNFAYRGNCSYGDRCRFVHEGAARSPSRGRDAPRSPSRGRDAPAPRSASPARFGRDAPRSSSRGRSPKGKGKGKSRSGSPRRFEGQAAGRGHPSRSPAPNAGGRPYRH